MVEREKVIRGLEVCNQYRFFGRDCYGCPYYGEEFSVCNIQDMLDDALSLLKEQEPKVMTQEEVLATPEGVVVWMEEKSECGTYIQPIVSTGNGCLGNFYIGVGAYGVEMRERRFWTSRPNEQVRRDTPWES